MEIIFRYKKLIKPLDLEEVLRDPTSKDSIEIQAGKANINKLITNIKKVLNNPNIKREDYDSKIYKFVHKTFEKLPAEVTSDLRFWQYLCLNDFKFFVEKRFKDPTTHFLGSQTLGGSHDNALGRRWKL